MGCMIERITAKQVFVHSCLSPCYHFPSGHLLDLPISLKHPCFKLQVPLVRSTRTPYWAFNPIRTVRNNFPSSSLPLSPPSPFPSSPPSVLSPLVTHVTLVTPSTLLLFLVVVVVVVIVVDAYCQWSSGWTSLLQVIIWIGQPIANDHPNGLAFCKWSSGRASLLQMILPMGWPWDVDT